MTIDRVFSATQEENDRARAQINVLTIETLSDDWPPRMVRPIDFESTSPKPGEALSNRTWQIRCEGCDPERGGYCWFSLNQCDTPAKALDCIMQLNENRPSPIVMQSFIDLMEYLFGRGAITPE
jgi:hypothetical protein